MQPRPQLIHWDDADIALLQSYWAGASAEERSSAGALRERYAEIYKSDHPNRLALEACLDAAAAWCRKSPWEFLKWLREFRETTKGWENE